MSIRVPLSPSPAEYLERLYAAGLSRDATDEELREAMGTGHSVGYMIQVEGAHGSHRYLRQTGKDF